MTGTTDSVSITINKPQLAQENPAMLQAVIKRCMRYAEHSITVLPATRKPNGWLEWEINVHMESRPALVIGAIQRHHDQDVEFHS